MISPNLTIEEILAKTKDLPTMPAATIKVLKETDRSDASALSVARIVLQDQSLAARVLRLANSAYYGLPRQVTEMQDAVVVLGMRTLRNLALMASTYTWLQREIKGYALGPEDMWRHALGTAVGAQLIAEKTRKADADSAFICGLLHDLGKLALAVWLEGKTNILIELSNRQAVGFDFVEKQVLGFDHCDVGAHLAAQWNLPEMFQLAMKYHHHPSECEPHSSVVDAVHIADHLAMGFGLGLGGDGLRYVLDCDALDRLGIDEMKYEELAALFIDRYETASESFGAILR